MAEGNGELVDDINQKSEDRGDGERTEDYPKLLEYGLDKKVSTVDYKSINIIKIKSKRQHIVLIDVKSKCFNSTLS